MSFFEIFSKKFKKVTFLKFSMKKIKIVKMTKKITNCLDKDQKVGFFL